MNTHNAPMNSIYDLCNGIEYTRDIPEEAKQIARETGHIVIVGESDNLMYCYGAECHLTEQQEHGFSWEGNDFIGIADKQLECEARQLGLKVFWCGKIEKTGETISEYDVDKYGGFSYRVQAGIKYQSFTVYEDAYQNEVYCTGIIVKLPEWFKSCMYPIQ